MQADTPPADPELARVADAWSNLPDHIRSAILSLVEAAGRPTDARR